MVRKSLIALAVKDNTVRGFLRLQFVALLLCVMASSSMAQSLIRDAEIEATLDRISNPIFRAALLNPSSVRIYIVNDDDLNAFVAGGQNIFLYSGLLTRLQTLDQLRAVIAHETGHIAGGHLTRRDQAMRGARGVAVLGMIGAAAATLGGSPEAGLAIAAGSQSIAQRNMLAHSRAEEAAADQAGLRYTAAAGSDPAAMLEVLRYFQRSSGLRDLGANSYTRTHPLWSERIALIEDRVSSIRSSATVSEEDKYWHRRMVAKFSAFLDPPAKTLKRLQGADASDEITVLSRAIAQHRLPDVSEALASADALIEMRPDDPYYHELRGQILLESGRAQEAAASYRRASELAPHEPLILAGLGRALLNTSDTNVLEEARDALKKSTRRDRANTGALRDLALAEARLGNDGMAALATAERYLVEGEISDARRNAQRAYDMLPAGSPGWRRSQDLLSMTGKSRK